MKIWFISDTHGEHAQLKVPDVDLVVHCGDESNDGDPWVNEKEARQFFEWFSKINIPTKMFVPGNHSTAIEKELIQRSEYPSVQFLIHEETEWMGLKIFGSPFTPQFYDWAYMKPREDLDSDWQMIAEEVDILITHGPPKGILDVTRDFSTRLPVHERIKPRIHAFGHIHDEQGIRNCDLIMRDTTQFINCSVCDISGRFENNGFVVEIDSPDSEQPELRTARA
jgi:Icc-related predicted phosphoesterase